VFKVQEPGNGFDPDTPVRDCDGRSSVKITACAVVEHDDGSHGGDQARLFGSFKRERREAEGALEIRPDVVVWRAPGVYWKSPFAALEAVGIVAWVVSARHRNAVPGARPNMADAQ
jgi:hypothetical protein